MRRLRSHPCPCTQRNDQHIYFNSGAKAHPPSRRNPLQQHEVGSPESLGESDLLVSRVTGCSFILSAIRPPPWQHLCSPCRGFPQNKRCISSNSTREGDPCVGTFSELTGNSPVVIENTPATTIATNILAIALRDQELTIFEAVSSRADKAQQGRRE